MLVVAALMVGLSATPALAQDGDQPAYATKYANAMKQAKQASQLESTNIEQAANTYEEVYTALNQASQEAQEAGNLEHSDQIRLKAAQIAYRAGKLLYDDGQLEPAMEHFQAGMDIEPSFAQNRQALNAAEQTMKQGPVVDASRALNSGNPREALAALEGVEETANVLFYKAEAYNALNENQEALSFARRAVQDGSLSNNKEARLYLLIGEVQMKEGNTADARTSLERAQQMGSAQVRDRAAALLGQIN